MGYVRLWKHDLTIQRAYSGADTRLVPAPSAQVDVYKQGATVSSTKSLSGGTDTIAVYDTGGIVVGDVLQLNTTSTTTFAVTAVANNQLTVGSFTNGTQVSAGDRLVVQSTRPSVFDNPSGTNQVDPTNQGRAPSTGATTGSTSFYLAFPVCDVIASAGGLVASQLITDLSGQMESRVVRLEDFGGYESSLLQGTGETGNFDNAAGATGPLGTFIGDALSYLDAIGGGTLELGPGTYYFSQNTTWTNINNVKIKGAGQRRTVLYLNNSAGALFTFPSSCTDCGLEDLTVQRVSGSAAHLVVSAQASRTKFTRVRFNGVGSGVSDAGIDTELVDCVWNGAVHKGILVTSSSQGLRIVRPRFRCSGGNIGSNALLDIGNGTNPPVDVAVEDFFNSWDDPSDKGIAVGINADCRRVTFLGGTFTGGDGSGAGANGIVIASGKGVVFVGPQVHTSAVGIVSSGGTGNRIMFPQVVNCQSFGINVTGGGHLDIVAPQVSDNNTLNAATTGQIEVAGTVSNCRILLPRVGQLGVGPTSSGVIDYSIDVGDGNGTGFMLIGAHGSAGSGGLWRIGKAGVVNTKYLTYGLNLAQLSATAPMSGIAVGIRAHTTEVTPDVEGVSYITSNPTAGSISVTNFLGGIVGQIVTIENLHASNTVTIAHGGNYSLVAGSGSVVLQQYETAMFQLNSNLIWRQIVHGAP